MLINVLLLINQYNTIVIYLHLLIYFFKHVHANQFNHYRRDFENLENVKLFISLLYAKQHFSVAKDFEKES